MLAFSRARGAYHATLSPGFCPALEFPPLPGSVDGYEGASDAYIDANVQFAIAAARYLRDGGDGRRVHIVVPDEDELNRSRKMFGGFLSTNPEVSMGCLTGNSAGSIWGKLGSFLKSGTDVVAADEAAKTADGACF